MRLATILSKISLETLTQNKDKRRLYCEMTIWRQIDDQTLIRYRCFHVLPDNKYCVKASDFVRYPLQESVLKTQEQYYLESLFDDGLEMLLTDACNSLEEAVAKHNQDFDIVF